MKIRVNGTDDARFPFPVDDGDNRTHRSAAAEWQPHRTQGNRPAEWWTLTAMVRDPAGMRYFVSWTVTRSGQGLYAGRLTLISYQASIRMAGVPAVFIVNDHKVWDAEASTLRLRDAQHEHECAWSFDGERMDLAVSSPTLGFNLKIQGGSQVLWAGGSYSLPHLQVAGSVTYADERGKPTTVDVSGTGWADRQWGEACCRPAKTKRNWSHT